MNAQKIKVTTLSGLQNCPLPTFSFANLNMLAFCMMQHRHKCYTPQPFHVRKCLGGRRGRTAALYCRALCKKPKFESYLTQYCLANSLCLEFFINTLLGLDSNMVCGKRKDKYMVRLN